MIVVVYIYLSIYHYESIFFLSCCCCSWSYHSFIHRWHNDKLPCFCCFFTLLNVFMQHVVDDDDDDDDDYQRQTNLIWEMNFVSSIHCLCEWFFHMMMMITTIFNIDDMYVWNIKHHWCWWWSFLMLMMIVYNNHHHLSILMSDYDDVDDDDDEIEDWSRGVRVSLSTLIIFVENNLWWWTRWWWWNKPIYEFTFGFCFVLLLFFLLVKIIYWLFCFV